MYEIKVKKKIRRQIEKLPSDIIATFHRLVADLMSDGPVQVSWPNYSKLSPNTFHCHLSYHYVACWRFEKGTITIEVYYVGSRENAPY